MNRIRQTHPNHLGPNWWPLSWSKCENDILIIVISLGIINNQSRWQSICSTISIALRFEFLVYLFGSILMSTSSIAQPKSRLLWCSRSPQQERSGSGSSTALRLPRCNIARLHPGRSTMPMVADPEEAMIIYFFQAWIDDYWSGKTRFINLSIVMSLNLSTNQPLISKFLDTWKFKG